MEFTRLEPTGVNTTATFTFANATITANLTAGNVKTDHLLYANGTPYSFSGGGGSGTPGGSDTQVQYNDSGSFAGSANLTFDKTSNTLTVTNITANGAGLTNITGANVTGNVGNALIAGTVYTNAQPNITSLGTLSSLTVTANVSSGNANLGNLITANFFSGAGNLLSNIQGANVSGQVSNALVAGTVYTNAQPNITSLGTLSELTVTGNLTVSGAFEYANVSTLNIQDPIIEQGGNPDGTALSSNDGYDRGQLLHYYTTKPVDAFMGYKNSSGEFIFASNASVSSEVVTVNTYGNIHAGNANLGNLATSNYFTGNGSLLTSIAGANVTGFVPNANVANTAYSISGGNVSGQVGNALVAGTVYTNAQPNITSVGTLSSLTITGNVSSGNANLGNLVTANFFSGAGNLLSNIAGANVSGQVGNALVAGTVYTNAQPNITSVGTLTGLTVSGTTNLGSATNVKITGGLNNQVLTTDGLGNLSWTTGGGGSGSSGGAGFITVTKDTFTATGSANTYTLSITPTSAAYVVVNIDGIVQQLSSYSLSSNVLTITDMPAAGEVIEVTSYGVGGLPGGSTTQVQFNDSGVFQGAPSFTFNSSTGTVAATNFTGNLTTAAQPNITSVGTLSSLTSSGLIVATSGGIKVGNIQDPSGTNTISLSSGNISVTSNVTATYFIGNGSQLTGLPATYANTNVASYLPTYTGNITGNIVTLTGNITAINANLGNLVTANYHSGNGSLLTSLTGGNVTGQVGNALVSSTVYTGDQPNITSVGTLTSLTASGNVAGQYLQSTNSQGDEGGEILLAKAATNTTLVGTGVTIDVYQNKLRIFEQGGTARGAYIDLTAAGAGVGSNLLASGGGGGGTPGGSDTQIQYNSSGSFAGSAGFTFISASNSVSVAGNVTSSYIVANGSSLTGQVPNALVAGTVYTAAQPNITSLGTITNLTVSGNLSVTGNISGNIISTGLFAHQQTQETYIPLTSSNVSTGNVDRAFTSGATFFFTSSPGSNINLRLTSFTGTVNRATVVTVLITQGATPYIPANISISNTATANTTYQTIKWLAGVTPTGTASKTDAFVFTILCTTANTAFTVLGQSSTYG